MRATINLTRPDSLSEPSWQVYIERARVAVEAAGDVFWMSADIKGEERIGWVVEIEQERRDTRLRNWLERLAGEYGAEMEWLGVIDAAEVSR